MFQLSFYQNIHIFYRFNDENTHMPLDKKHMLPFCKFMYNYYTNYVEQRSPGGKVSLQFSTLSKYLKNENK